MEFKITSGCYNISLTAPDGCTNGTTTMLPAVKLDPTNHENPYDEIGQAHNDALEALGQKFPAGDFQDAELLKAVLSFLQTYSFKNEEIKAKLEKSGPEIIDCFGGWSFKAGIEPFNVLQPQATTIATEELMGRYKNAGVRIGEIGARMVAFDNGKESAEGLIAFYKALDKEAMQAKLNDEDRAGLLTMLSVARHSTAFWALQVQVPAALTSGPGLSDIKGAASGAAAGVVTGAGVVICAAVGAIGRSLGYWLGSKK